MCVVMVPYVCVFGSDCVSRKHVCVCSSETNVNKPCVGVCEASECLFDFFCMC